MSITDVLYTGEKKEITPQFDPIAYAAEIHYDLYTVTC